MFKWFLFYYAEKLANLVVKKVAARLSDYDYEELLPTGAVATAGDILLPSGRTSVRAGIAEGLAQAAGKPELAEIMPVKHPFMSDLGTILAGGVVGTAAGAALGNPIVGGTTGAALGAVLNRIVLNRQLRKIKNFAKAKGVLDPKKITIGDANLSPITEVKNRGRLGTRAILEYVNNFEKPVNSDLYNRLIGSNVAQGIGAAVPWWIGVPIQGTDLLLKNRRNPITRHMLKSL